MMFTKLFFSLALFAVAATATSIPVHGSRDLQSIEARCACHPTGNGGVICGCGVGCPCTGEVTPEADGSPNVAYPLARHFMNKNKDSTDASASSALNNANMRNISSWSLIAFSTPKDAVKLVFSDEFETDGRSFYPGDDPYWEAVDLHYWQTGDLEWYDSSAVTIKNGALEITLTAHRRLFKRRG
ncbi:beta-glucan synthesis-associated protein-domain-containing protein [Mycena leptocephala]|nr:beta-glucan synthesis-associated protein-domain-containing protein [Mycena leptocephala]